MPANLLHWIDSLIYGVPSFCYWISRAAALAASLSRALYAQNGSHYSQNENDTPFDTPLNWLDTINLINFVSTKCLLFKLFPINDRPICSNVLQNKTQALHERKPKNKRKNQLQNTQLAFFAVVLRLLRRCDSRKKRIKYSNVIAEHWRT